MEAAEPVRDKQGFCIPVGPGMEVAFSGVGVDTLGDTFSLLLLHWNKLPKALRLVPSGGVCSPHLTPRPALADYLGSAPLPQSLALTMGSLGVHLSCSLELSARGHILLVISPLSCACSCSLLRPWPRLPSHRHFFLPTVILFLFSRVPGAPLAPRSACPCLLGVSLLPLGLPVSVSGLSWQGAR